MYSNLAAKPNSLRSNSSFVEIITKYPQIFQPGSGVFFYDGLWSHSAIVVNPLSTLTNYFSPITSPGNSPAIVEQDGKFDYLLSNDYSIKYDEKTGLPIRNPNPERQIRSIDDTTNQNLTQISIVPTSLIYPSAYNLDTALMPNTMTGDGKNCLVVEQGQNNEYSLLYCPALPSGATP